MPQQLSNIDFTSTGAKITGLPDPTAAQDAATKAYVDANIEGLAWKDNARVATTANLGAFTGVTVVDGVTLAAGDRVLVKDQTAQSANGIYVWSAGGGGTLARAADASTFDELESAIIPVDEGTAVGLLYRQTQVNGTIGTDNVVWSPLSTSSPAASEATSGIAELATQAETDAGSDDLRIVTPLKLKNAKTVVHEFAATIGDAVSTSLAVTHSLGTRDITVAVRNASTHAMVQCDWTATSTTVATFVFATAPASGALRVMIQGTAD